jgi:hypothetical protein
MVESTQSQENGNFPGAGGREAGDMFIVHLWIYGFYEPFSNPSGFLNKPGNLLDTGPSPKPG